MEIPLTPFCVLPAHYLTLCQRVDFAFLNQKFLISRFETRNQFVVYNYLLCTGIQVFNYLLCTDIQVFSYLLYIDIQVFDYLLYTDIQIFSYLLHTNILVFNYSCIPIITRLSPITNDNYFCSALTCSSIRKMWRSLNSR